MLREEDRALEEARCRELALGAVSRVFVPVKKVLKKDKDNYMGLVFCGLCLSELEQPDQAIQVRHS